jgi:hypothetical protein
MKTERPHPSEVVLSDDPKNWAPAIRARAFNEAIDKRMKPTSEGGRGLKMDAALDEMREDPFGAKLLAAMGGARLKPTANDSKPIPSPATYAKQYEQRQ